MADPAPQTCLPTCIACGYDIASLNTRLCPECGFNTTDEDVELDSRRRMYLEMTARQTWQIWAASLLLALWSGAMSFLPWFVLIVLCMPGAIYLGGLRVTRGWPSLHRSAYRRSWWMSSAYWLAPLLFLHAVGSFVLGWGYLRYGGNRMSSFRFVPVIGFEIFAFALAIPLWYYGWRRSVRLAGVPSEMRSRSMFKKGAVFACGPVLIALMLAIAAFGAIAILDATGR